MSTRMNRAPMAHGYAALTEKEKQTLRLIVRGHDAKSVARNLGLSVHTINERLRDARRKLAVSSSREAARLLLDAEGDAIVLSANNSVGDMEIGEAAARSGAEQGAASIDGARRTHRLWITMGVLLMSLFLGLLALAALPQFATSTQSPVASAEATNTAAVEAARVFLVLGDQARWQDGYRLTGAAFRKLNTSQAWTRASQRVRTPLGAMLSRTLISAEDVPAPPHGYEVVKFRTSFEKKPDLVETVTLELEDGGWHVVGITVG